MMKQGDNGEQTHNLRPRGKGRSVMFGHPSLYFSFCIIAITLRLHAINE
jgi:hypothetical protein